MFLLSLVSAMALYAFLESFVFKFPSKEIFGFVLSASLIVVSIKAFRDLEIDLHQALNYYSKRGYVSYISGLKYFGILLCFIFVVVGLIVAADFLLSYFNLLPIDTLTNSLIPESVIQTGYISTNLIGSPWRLSLFVTEVCVFAPIGEELIFRRLLYISLRNKYSFPFSLIISSLVFGIIHGGGWFIVFGKGLLIGYFYEKNRDVLAAIFLHSSINILALILGFAALWV